MKNVRVAGALLQVRSLLLLFGVTRPGLLRAADVSNVFHFSFKDDEYKCCWLVAELPSCRLSAPAGPIDAEKVSHICAADVIMWRKSVFASPYI